MGSNDMSEPEKGKVEEGKERLKEENAGLLGEVNKCAITIKI